jgi:hypothetical protein
MTALFAPFAKDPLHLRFMMHKNARDCGTVQFQ